MLTDPDKQIHEAYDESYGIYIEKMCYEFSRLLYDVSEEHQRICNEWAQKYAALETRCQEYELRLLEGNGKCESFIYRLNIRLRRRCKTFYSWIRRGCIRIARMLFSLGRRITTRLGIKDRLKRTRIFQKLYLRGTIDKLRK